MLSISIVTYKIARAEFSAMLLSLDNALLKLVQHRSLDKINITIIDNANQRGLLEELIVNVQREYTEYELISGHGNIGYGRANNFAIKKTQAKYHLILNPDILVAENALVAGLDYLEKAHTEKICAVTPRVIGANGKMQYLCKRYPSAFNFLLRGFAPKSIKNLFKKRLDHYECRDKIKTKLTEPVVDVPLISGCFMLCDTECLQKVGGFNENIFLHFEDLALSLELKKYGLLSYLPAMQIQHFGGHSAKRGFKHILIFIRSGIKFFNIYGWKIV